MYKKSPFFTASTASVMYFVIFLMLKLFLQTKIVDWQIALQALQGAIIFWIVIFAVHQILIKRYLDLDE